jgi:hypothetical protein
MFKEHLPSADDPERTKPIEDSQASSEPKDKTREVLAKGTVVAKQEDPGYWSMVGSSHFYFPDTYSVKVELPDGFEKWLNVTEAAFEELKEGDEAVVPLKPWEQQEYVSELERIVEKATSFDDLKSGFLSFGKIQDRSRDYSIDDLVETLNHIQERKGGSIGASFSFLPEINGLKEKVMAFKGDEGKSWAVLGNPEDMSDEDLVRTYKAIQLEISNLISRRDSIERNIDQSGSARADFQKVQERIQTEIENAFAVLGNYRHVIDERGLQTITLGELDRMSDD